jgi:putative ABC transport system ATP-binding protein
LLLAGVAADERKARVAQLIEDYGLVERAGHRPDQLSGGQRQRVAIARATVMQPAVILADEPTGNLDRATGQEVMAILEGLAARGVTLILVTHDPEIGQRATRKLRMVDGRIAGDQRG